MANAEVAQWLLHSVAARIFPGSNPGLRFFKMKKIKPSEFKWENTGNGYFRKVFMIVKNKPNKDCKVQFVRIPPNTVVKPHFHKGQTESEYVVAGSGSIKSKKKIINLRPGVLFIVDSNESHEVKSNGKGLLLFVTKANYSDDTEWCE